MPSSSSTPAKWSANLINVLNHSDPALLAQSAPITCILPMPHNVYTGDEDGRVVSESFSIFWFSLWIASILTYSSTNGTACIGNIESLDMDYFLLMMELTIYYEMCICHLGLA